MSPASSLQDENDSQRSAVMPWMVAVFAIKGAEALSYAAMLRHLVLNNGTDLRIFAAWFIATRLIGLTSNQICQYRIGVLRGHPATLWTLVGDMVTPVLISLAVFFLLWSAA